MTTTLDVTQDRQPVVLLRQERATHLHANRWAQELARGLQTELVVVRLMGEPRRGRRRQSARADDVRRVMGAQARWLRRFGGQRSLPALLSLSNKTSTPQLGRVLAELRPRVVVMGSAGVWPGDSAAWLSRECGSPCLVARPSHGRGVVAASSLEDAGLPVLGEAAAWARALGRPLTVVHNREPPIIESTSSNTTEGLLWGAAERLGADAASLRGSTPSRGSSISRTTTTPT